DTSRGARGQAPGRPQRGTGHARRWRAMECPGAGGSAIVGERGARHAPHHDGGGEGPAAEQVDRAVAELAARPWRVLQATSDGWGGHMLDLGLEGKVALITGGSDGLGRAAAARLAAEGARVAICARRGPHLEKVAAELRAATGGEVLPVTADVSRVDDCRRFVDEAVRAFGGVDILLNNAGTSAARGLEEVDDDAWQA